MTKRSARLSILEYKAITQTQPKPSKMRNKKVTVDGKSFDSKWEYERYNTLKILERSGEIKQLQTQVPFELCVNGIQICKYIADFVYFSLSDELIVEDAKGRVTPEYRLKKKLMKAIHQITIKETYKNNISYGKNNTHRKKRPS